VHTVTQVAQAHGKTVRVYFMDEARIGQQGTLTRVWARRGSRPTAIKQTRYEWVYLYAAVAPQTGASTALIAPTVNTGVFNVFLKMLADDLQPDEHAVLILDQAGWHVSKKLRLPGNITMLLLPAHSPELNPVENLWHHMRSHRLSNRAYRDYDHLMDATGEAYRDLTPELLQSVCRCTYLTHEKKS
jgi:transposase